MNVLEQREITRVCIHCALLLLQHGAESMLVEQLSTRLGLALGVDCVESSISYNAVVLTTISKGHCLTTTRKNIDRGVNMYMVTEVQHIVILTERHLLGLQDIGKHLHNIKPWHYPNGLVVVFVGVSCGCFCQLNGGGWDGALVSFVAGGVAMYVRQKLTQHQINPLIVFLVTAFVATSISGGFLQLAMFSQTSVIAMAASVLLLVPGFPLINAVADMFKGHVNTGLARWGVASLLTLFTCMGVVMALAVWGLKSWA